MLGTAAGRNKMEMRLRKMPLPLSATYFSEFSLQPPEMIYSPTHSGMLGTPHQIHLQQYVKHVHLQRYIKIFLKSAHTY